MLIRFWFFKGETQARHELLKIAGTTLSDSPTPGVLAFNSYEVALDQHEKTRAQNFLEMVLNKFWVLSWSITVWNGSIKLHLTIELKTITEKIKRMREHSYDTRQGGVAC